MTSRCSVEGLALEEAVAEYTASEISLPYKTSSQSLSWLNHTKGKLE